MCSYSTSFLFSQSIIVALCLTRVLVPSILPSKTVRRRDSLLNTWPNQFFCLCRMVFIKLLFSSTMSKTSWLDRWSVQLKAGLCSSKNSFKKPSEYVLLLQAVRRQSTTCLLCAITLDRCCQVTTQRTPDIHIATSGTVSMMLGLYLLNNFIPSVQFNIQKKFLQYTTGYNYLLTMLRCPSGT